MGVIGSYWCKHDDVMMDFLMVSHARKASKRTESFQVRGKLQGASIAGRGSDWVGFAGWGAY